MRDFIGLFILKFYTKIKQLASLRQYYMIFPKTLKTNFLPELIWKGEYPSFKNILGSLLQSACRRYNNRERTKEVNFASGVRDWWFHYSKIFNEDNEKMQHLGKISLFKQRNWCPHEIFFKSGGLLQAATNHLLNVTPGAPLGCLLTGDKIKQKN